MPCQLEIKNLHFAFNKSTVIDDLSFTADENGIVGLLGLNGEGKSTLLKIIAGILPAGNSMTFKPGVASDWHPVGYLPERPAFYPELTVNENMTFAASLNGISKHQQTPYIDEALKLTRLEDRQQQLAGSLSKGYQQRLGLAMAISHKPELLLLDEPTDGLDPQQIQETHNLISSLAQDSCIIISSHRLDEIDRLCQRVAILHNGKMAHDVTIADTDIAHNLENLFAEITGGKPS
ncbi:MAG: ABC transporter ATP-binding protein [Gammaproteobacteria bacterium]|nr:ABC transporter ATP-binding protein [Gammaproteobacteria bacterium]